MLIDFGSIGLGTEIVAKPTSVSNEVEREWKNNLLSMT